MFYRKDPHIKKMKLQKLLSLLRQAIDQYHMIEAEDHRNLRRQRQPYLAVWSRQSSEILSDSLYIICNYRRSRTGTDESQTDSRALQQLSYSLRGCDHRDWKNPLRHPQRNKSMLSLRKDEKRRAKPESHGTWMQ